MKAVLRSVFHLPPSFTNLSMENSMRLATPPTVNAEGYRPKTKTRSQSCLARPLSATVKIQTMPVIVHSQPLCLKDKKTQTPSVIPTELCEASEALSHSVEVQVSQEVQDGSVQTDDKSPLSSSASVSCQTETTFDHDFNQPTFGTHSASNSNHQQINLSLDQQAERIIHVEIEQRLHPVASVISTTGSSIVGKDTKACEQQTELSGELQQTICVTKDTVPPTSCVTSKRHQLCKHAGIQTDQPELRGTYAEKAIYILKSVEDFRHHFDYELREDKHRQPVLHITRRDLYGAMGWEGQPIESVLTNLGVLTHRVAYLPPKHVQVASEHGDLGFDTFLAEMRWLLSVTWFCPGIEDDVFHSEEDADVKVGVKRCDHPEPRYMDAQCPVVMVTDRGRRKRCSFCDCRRKMLQRQKRKCTEDLLSDYPKRTKDDDRGWNSNTTNKGKRKKRSHSSRVRYAADQSHVTRADRDQLHTELIEAAEYYEEMEKRTSSGNAHSIDDAHSIDNVHSIDDIVMSFADSSESLAASSEHDLELGSQEEHAGCSRTTVIHKTVAASLNTNTEVTFSVPLLFQTSTSTAADDDIPLD